MTLEFSGTSRMSLLLEMLSGYGQNRRTRFLVGMAFTDRKGVPITIPCDPNSFKTVTDEQQLKADDKTSENALDQSDEIVAVHEPLLSEAEAAKFLGISKMTLLRKRNAGNIGFFRVGFRVLYSKEKHLIPFLDKCETRP